MPAFPERHDRGRNHHQVWRDTRTPGVENHWSMLRGAAIGVAVGTAMWVVIIMTVVTAARWLFA
jgi:hypothetical protein